LLQTQTIVPGSAEAQAAPPAPINEQTGDRRNALPARNGRLGILEGNGELRHPAHQQNGSTNGNGRKQQEMDGQEPQDMALVGMTPTGLARRLGRCS
jgi:hypothetical protein